MIPKCARIIASLLTALSLTLSVPGGARADSADQLDTTTPIKHLVVIFQENVSFDHYFATYPYASNATKGDPVFVAKPDTPTVNNLLSAGLLMNNPNTVQPFPLSRNEAVTCDQSHAYTSEQQAADHGLMDNFPAANGTDNASFGIIPSTLPTPVLFGVNQPTFDFTDGKSFVAGAALQPGQYYETGSAGYQGYCYDAGKGTGIVMGYYDGNTVTALWNYAQHFAMSDNSWDTNFGPSAPGAVNVISGNTYSATMKASPNGKVHSASGYIWGATTTGSLIGDARPYNDDCDVSNSQLQGSAVAVMNGPETPAPANVGDLMGDLGFPNPPKQVTWGWFMGGFAPTGTLNGRAVCGSAGAGIAGFGDGALPDNITTVGDYIPHHEPFQYYTSSQNLKHVPPTGTIGTTDQANHQYDLALFKTALQNHQLPAVSYIKAPAWEDGHPGYSDPLDEQKFLVTIINEIMGSDEWKDTAIVILYDDSDGWYDHAASPIVNQSGATGNADDAYSATGFCGQNSIPSEGIQGRCGYGTRQPLLVISPWAKENYVDHSTTDQSSIVRFIEDNWNLGRLGNGSSDAKAGSLLNMFDFDQDRYYRRMSDESNRVLLLNSGTGEPVNLGFGNSW